jgi:uncharacterized membrane protein
MKYWLCLAATTALAVACTDRPVEPTATPGRPLASNQAVPVYEAIDLGVELASSQVVINNEGVAHGLFVAEDGGTHVFRWADGVFTDLGALPSPSRAGVISPGGTVAGILCPDEFCHPVSQAYSWKAGVVTTLDLGRTFQFGAHVLDVTDDGNVLVGTSEEGAFFFRDGVRHDIMQLLPGRPGDARDMNQRGQVVGFSFAPGYRHFRSYVWRNGEKTMLAEIPFACGSDPSQQCSNAHAFAINDHGDVAGQASDATGSNKAVLWPAGEAPIFLGGFNATLLNNRRQVVVGADLWDNGTRYRIGDDFTQILALNDKGEVTGGQFTFTPDFKVEAFIWRQGTTIELGTGPGTSSRGLALNDLGDVIGYYFGDDFVTKAMIWKRVRE